MTTPIKLSKEEQELSTWINDLLSDHMIDGWKADIDNKIHTFAVSMQRQGMQKSIDVGDNAVTEFEYSWAYPKQAILKAKDELK